MQWLLDVDQDYLRDLERPARARPVRHGWRTAFRAALAALSVIVIGEVAILAVPGLKAKLFGSGAATSPASPHRPPAAAIAASGTLPAQAVVVVGPVSPTPATARPAPRPPSVPPTLASARPSRPLIARAAVPLPHPIEAIPAPARSQADSPAAAAPLAHPVEAALDVAPSQPKMARARAGTAPSPGPTPVPAGLVPSPATAAAPPPPIEAAPSPTRSQPAIAKAATAPPPVATPKAHPLTAAAAPQMAPAARSTASAARPTPTPPLDQHLRVELSFTSDEAGTAAAFAHQLRRQGFAVTSRVIPATPGRWPGVAFFFDSDRAQARALARQLGAVTGRHEHARLSPRHPYPKPGTVEVSLLSNRTPAAGSAGRASDPHRRP
jgi:hypothetical protein